MNTIHSLAVFATTLLVAQARPYTSSDGHAPLNTTWHCPNSTTNSTANGTTFSFPPLQLAKLNSTDPADEHTAHSYDNQAAVFNGFLGFMIFIAIAYPFAVGAAYYFGCRKTWGSEVPREMPEGFAGAGEDGGEEADQPAWLRCLLSRAGKPAVVI